MRILLTGKNGQLGRELHRQLERDHKTVAIGRDDLNFQDTRLLSKMLRGLPEIDLIVNAAAYTNVDKAELEPFVAEAINSEATAILAAEADYRGIPMIHFSTDYVFDGRGTGVSSRRLPLRRTTRCGNAVPCDGRWIYERVSPYTEKDRPNPISCYGRTKLGGEIRIRNILEKHLIFRLSSLYGERRKNFYTTMTRCYHSGETPDVVRDQIVSPNWTPLVAEAVVHVIGRMSHGEVSPWGTYHLSGDGNTSWYEFSRLIFRKLNDRWNNFVPLPISVTSVKFDAPADRPKYSVLDSTRFNKTFQYSLPDWKEQFLLFIGGLQPETHKYQEKIPCSIF